MATTKPVSPKDGIRGNELGLMSSILITKLLNGKNNLTTIAIFMEKISFFGLNFSADSSVSSSCYLHVDASKAPCFDKIVDFRKFAVNVQLSYKIT
jgi:hypothetical protein